MPHQPAGWFAMTGGRLIAAPTKRDGDWMADLNKLARNSAMLNGTTPYRKTQKSRYDEGLQRQFFGDGTRDYATEAGPIASNVYWALCQGLDRENFYNFKPVILRPAGAAKSATGETMPDDWQRVHVLKPRWVSELPPGAYLTFAGNTWIVYKGTNIASVQGDGIIRRCNSVINVLDWYGNIVSVPMSYAKMGTLGNASHATENSIVAKNYISCVCQLNEYSAAFAENTRLILGKAAYSIRGLNDFTREFTDDQDSVHMLTFTIERSAPLPQDSMEKQCADYFSFRWELSVQGLDRMNVGQKQTLTVQSTRMGESVSSTEERPITYLFESDSPEVLTVDAEGNVNAVGAGTAEITVRLAQNTDILQTWQVEVQEAPSGTSVQFLETVPAELREMESTQIRAAVVTDGEARAEALEIRLSGAGKYAYSVSKTGENTWRVDCYAASARPLIVEVSDGNGHSASTKIKLRG